MSYAAAYYGLKPVVRLREGGTSIGAWVRPAEWIALPAAPAQGVSALYGVENSDGNYVAVICTTVSGDYTVDWGDGTTPTTVASNVVAEHLYDYSAITTALTVDGMKQVVVTITGNMKTVDFNKRHSRPGLVAAMAVNWLEVNIQGASITSILFSGSTENIQCKYLERVNIGTVGTITNTTNMFASCVSLQSVPLFNTASVTSMQGMFTNCYSLQSVPLFNTALVQNMSYMFNNCYSLQSVPLFNTASVTTMSYMFQSCYSLQSVPLFNTALVQNMSYMFNNCYSLQSVPLFNTASVTTMSYMFQSCYSLQSVPLFNTASVTNMSLMFYGCYSLQSVPLFNTASVTNMSYMFYNCYSLQSVPLFNTALVTNMYAMFNSCYSLQSVPLFNTASVTNMYAMFYSCYSLQSVPLFNTALVTNMYAMFQSCYSLQSVPLFNTASVINMVQMFYGCASLQSCPAFDLGYNVNKDRAPTLTIYNWTLGAGWTYGTNTLVKGSAGTGTTLALNPQIASITGAAATDIITATNHGFQEGDKIQFSAITGGAGLNTSAIYKVSATSLATSTFKVTDLNDVAIDFTTDITNGTVGRWNLAIVAATLYKVTIVVSELTAGTATYTLGGTAGTTISAAGTHIDYITTATAVKLTITPTDDARFIISSIKIEEVENMSSMFSGCRSLGKSDMVGLRHSVSYTSCKLSRAGIVNIFNNLGVAAISSPTAGYDIIDISSNHGTVDLTADDRLIATTKGWTINPA